MCKGLKQVQVVRQAAVELTHHPARSNWRSLQQALYELDGIRAAVTQPPESQAVEPNFSAASMNWLTRTWDEVQYFLAPVIITGWSILNKLGLLAAEIAQNLPLIGGLICTAMTTQQRIAIRITQVKTEDKKQLIDLCHLLTTTFEDIRRKQAMEHIFAQTQNTVTAAQQASNAAQQAHETKQAVENQSQQIAELKQKNAQLTKLVETQQLKIEEQSKKLDTIITLLTNSEETNLPSAGMPPVDKKV